MQALPRKYAWLAHPGFVATVCGALAFIFSAVAAPPPALVACMLSLPFFFYAAQSRWKDCIVWIIATMPFQYYFNLGGLSLTHTELYLFAFGGIYFLSRVFKEKSILLPSTLIIPALYGVSEFTSFATGHPDLAKHGIRTLTVVFFCPRPRVNVSPRTNWSGSWASLR